MEKKRRQRQLKAISLRIKQEAVYEWQTVQLAAHNSNFYLQSERCYPKETVISISLTAVLFQILGE